MNTAEEKARLNDMTAFEADDLCRLVRVLRSAEGCPWDAEQTHASLRQCLINESNEVVETIDHADSRGMCEELGDLLLQIVFHAVIAEEAGEFTFSDVATEACKKMLFRHPHVFKGTEAPRWEDIKAQEKELRRTGQW